MQKPFGDEPIFWDFKHLTKHFIVDITDYCITFVVYLKNYFIKKQLVLFKSAGFKT